MTSIVIPVSCVVLLTAGVPLVQLWRASNATALASAGVWAIVAYVAWLTGGVLLLADADLSGSPSGGLFQLASTILLLAPMVAVLGARWPGARAWNLIVATLLVVFSLPVLEQWLLGKGLEHDRIGFDAPRFVLFIMVAAVGVLNYIPTRFAAAAVLCGVGMAVQLATISPWRIEPSLVPSLNATARICLASALWMGWLCRPPRRPHGIESEWLFLRDGWGVVWALRIRDRWNAVAAYNGWPVRLTWRGLTALKSNESGAANQGDADYRPGAEHQFELLMKRFVSWRL